MIFSLKYMRSQRNDHRGDHVGFTREYPPKKLSSTCADKLTCFVVNFRTLEGRVHIHRCYKLKTFVPAITV